MAPDGQNKLEELFILLHFLEPAKFRDLEAFQEEFAEIGSEAQARRPSPSTVNP